jgi:murein DD-endopeptidase MepM/ murein hydrolase activator NlpD
MRTRLTAALAVAGLLFGAFGWMGQVRGDVVLQNFPMVKAQRRHLAKSLETGQVPPTLAFLPRAHAGTLPIGLVSAALAHAGPWHTYPVELGDTLVTVFKRAGLDSSQWLQVLRLGSKADALRHIRTGDVLRIRKTPSGKLAALSYPLNRLETLQIFRFGDHLDASVKKKPIHIRKVRVSGQIEHSLLGALMHAGVRRIQALKFADIFKYRVDLSRNIHRGDRFALILKRQYVDHHLVKSGPIIAARLVLKKQTLDAFRYEANDDPAYYDRHGRSFKRSLLRTPVHYTRVSSHFSRHRLNPVTHKWAPHYGVDLAAPKGTPIKAAASGRVKFAGRKRGYGNVVELKNFGPYSTRYAHMSRFAKGLHKGSHVHQGQVIGYVGATGWATGPHLHFEIRVGGHPKPPLKVKLPNGTPIPKKAKSRFEHSIQPLLAKLEATPGPGHTLLAQRETPGGGAVQCMPAKWFQTRLVLTSSASASCARYSSS